MRRKLWMIVLLAAALLIPAGIAKADAPLVVSPIPVITPNYAPEKPVWYPADTAGFQFFNDADAERVVDYADIFSDDEEAAIAQAIALQSARGGADIVVVTDSSSYGMSHTQYADDFYDYNGYGFGESRDGIVLFICMEPGNRGWWTSVTGRLDPAVSSGPVLYTESVANQLDDALYNFMVSGRYADGVLDWVNNVGTWLDYGIPFAPIWYPTVEEQAVFSRSRNKEADRISDSAGWFSKSERNDLEKQAKDIAESRGVDVVIHTARSDCGMGAMNYAKAFYQYGGYGADNDFSGVLLVMFAETGNYVLYSEGDVPSVLNDSEAVGRLLEMSESDAYDAGSAAAGAESYLKLLGKALKTNKVPHSTGSWILSGVLAALAGLLSGGVSRSSAAASMKTVRTAFDSNDYLVEGSFRVVNGYDEFVNVSTTRVFSPASQKAPAPQNQGGASQFSQGHVSSSGTTHSGSGRKF